MTVDGIMIPDGGNYTGNKDSVINFESFYCLFCSILFFSLIWGFLVLLGSFYFYFELLVPYLLYCAED